MKIIITENQVKYILNNVITENDIIGAIKNKLVNDFNTFKTNFSKQISSSNNLVDMNSLIEMMQQFILTKAPTVVQNGMAPNDFLNAYYDYMFQNFQAETAKLGWAKKKMLKVALGDINKAAPTMDGWKFKDLIWSLLNLGNISTDNNWKQTYNDIINKNKMSYYTKIRDLLIQSIYS